MNYTENYHLPQWDEDDRIMRSDFNAAMCNLENGLTGNARTAEKISQDGGAQDKLLLDRMLRLAYNHYLALQTIDPFPAQIGMFYQNAARDLPDTGSAWEGAQFVGGGTGGILSQTFFTQYVKTLSNLQMDKTNPANSSPMMVEICAPTTTKVANFNLRGNFSNNVPNTPAPFLLTVTNQDTGEVEQSFQLDLAQKNTGALLVNYLQPVTLYFFAGTHYLLKIEPIGNPVFTSNLEFYEGQGTQVQALGTGDGNRLDLSYTLRDREGSSLGLLILRCNAGGPSGKLTVQWDGETVTPAYVYPCQNDQGLPLREMIYVRRGTIPANTSFSVRFEAGGQGGIWFQDWGAILL